MQPLVPWRERGEPARTMEVPSKVSHGVKKAPK
jgi:hypothetical protein